MATGKKHMGGEEFIEKILQGERDFSGFRIGHRKGFDLSGHDAFEEMQEYLKQQDLEQNPVILENAILMNINAEGLYLPFVRAKDADFEGANLAYSFLYKGQFKNANFSGTNLRSAVLSYADFEDAGFSETDLRNSNLKGACLVGTFNFYANFRGADVQGVDWTCATCDHADLRGIKNLRQQGGGLDSVKFIEAIVTSAEKGTIEPFLQERFDVRLYGEQPFDVLGISQDASYDEARRAYRKRVKETHPDKFNGSKAKADEFKEVFAAWVELRLHYEKDR